MHFHYKERIVFGFGSLNAGNCSKFSLDLHNFLQKVCYEVLFCLLKFKLESEQFTSVTVYHAVEFLYEIAEL